MRFVESGIKCQLTDNKAISGLLTYNQIDGLQKDRDMNLETTRTVCRRLGIEEGSVLECMVTEVQKDRFGVILSVKASDLETARAEEAEPIVQETTRQSSRSRQRIKRSINHPFFKNFDYKQAQEYLNREGKVGDVVIRPSSKGMDHLAITYKFFGDMFMNLDVVEKDKSDPNSLGKRLLVNQVNYSDLDEIVYKCVDQTVEHARKLMEHPKYSSKNDTGIENELQDEKKQNPRGIPYRLALSSTPGKFNIHYLPARRVKTQSISVVPDGYKYSGRIFKNTTKLMNAFKTSYADKAQGGSSGRTQERKPTEQRRSSQWEK
jgi:transcription elongation factor SPT6